MYQYAIEHKIWGNLLSNFNRYAYQIRFMLLLLMSKYPPLTSPRYQPARGVPVSLTVLYS